MVIKTILLPAVSTNCYLVADEASKRCAIVDPGDPDPRILSTVRAEGWEVQCILLTHAHYDHTMGVPALRQELPGVPVYVHPGDAEMPKPFFRIVDLLLAFVVLRAGDTLLTGDTLFKGSMGRTDLPGGSYDAMRASLRRLGGLEGDLTVLPGHMDPSTLDHERKYNYYLKEAMQED